MYALDQTLSLYEVRRAAGVDLSSSAPLLSVDEGLVPLHTADDLVQQYNCGDLNSTLFASANEKPSVAADNGARSLSDVAITRQINDYFRNELIDRRNRRMAMRIDRLLTDRPDLSFFFAFGAGTYSSAESFFTVLIHLPPTHFILSFPQFSCQSIHDTYPFCLFQQATDASICLPMHAHAGVNGHE